MVLTLGAAETSDDQRFLAGLRARGLFRLAETYCTRRLERAELPEPQRAELTIELSRSLAEQAVASAPEAREPLWRRSQQVVEDFARQFPRSAQLPLMSFQAALGLLARGELARQEAELSGHGAMLVEEARTQLRTAIGRLRELADQADRQSRMGSLPGRRPAEPQAWTADELAAFRKNLRYELARALRNQGQCYESQSADRTNSLTQAVELLDPLSRLDPSEMLTWKSRLDLVECYRLLADWATCQRYLEAVLQQDPPAEMALRARAEQIRLALDTRRLADAVGLLSRGREIDGRVSPELDYAWLQACLVASRAACEAKDAAAESWQKKATELVRLIDSLHGPYWARRAEMLLAGYIRSGPEGGDLDLLVRAAESSFRSGRFDDALSAYDRARQSAAKQGNAQRAFELGYTAATIEHQRNRHAEALARYREIALALPRHAKAPEAHLLAIYHAAQLAKKSEGHAEPLAKGGGATSADTARAPATPLEQYVALLHEHIQTWPDGPGADDVRRRLGRLQQLQRDWPAAIELLKKTPPDDPKYLEAIDGVEQSYRAWLAERTAAREPTELVATAAARWFESLVVDAEGRLPERWSPAARLAALAAARMWMDYTSAGHDRAQRILTAALAGAGDAPQQWISSARILLVCSLAGAGRTAEAAQVLAQITGGPPEQLLGMLEGLGRAAGHARPDVRRELAQLQLQTVDMVQRGGVRLEPALRQKLERIHAQALADAGRTAQALAAYEALCRAHPQDVGLEQAQAQLLLDSNDRVSWKAALTKWRDLEQRSPEGSRRWLQAHYSMALLHYRLGNREHAARIIRVVEAQYPDLGGQDLKRQFLDLLERAK